MGANKAQAAGNEGEVPGGCTNLKLRQFTRRVSQHYDAQMSEAGLKGTQYSLLATVHRIGPVRPSDLAQALKLDASTLTRNLKPLVAAGWLALSSGPDGRSREVTMTPAGRLKFRGARRRWQAAQNQLTRALGRSRVVALHALIDESLALLAGQAQDDQHATPGPDDPLR